jgi:hypothetical protein
MGYAGISSALRTTEGMYINGFAVTAPLLAKFLHKLHIPPAEIHEMLEPRDAQDVPAAMRLVRALERVAGLKDTELNATERQERKFIELFGELFGAFVDAFTNTAISLKEQMTLLAKYAVLCAYLYRKHPNKFAKNWIYTDSQCCVKCAYFSLAKQQELDPEQLFFLFLLGTDALEKLFAGTRMIGGHDPNFAIIEFARRLSQGLDVDRILAEHPEWNAGLVRLAADVNKRADNLSPRTFDGVRADFKAGTVVLKETWFSGLDRAAASILRLLDETVSWPEWFRVPEADFFCDILRPLGGDPLGYPGVDVPEHSASDPPEQAPHDSVQQIFSSLPEEAARLAVAETEAVRAEERRAASAEASAIAVSALQVDSDNAEDEDVDEHDEMESTLAESHGSSDGSGGAQDAHDAALAAFAKKVVHYCSVNGVYVHNSSIITAEFNPWYRSQAQSKDRLTRIRTFSGALTLPGHLPSELIVDMFMVGDCVATLIRVGQCAYLAIVKVTHLLQFGRDVPFVKRSEVHIGDARIDVRGQVLCFVPFNSPPASLSTTLWTWSNQISRLRPVKKESSAADVLVLPFAGTTAIPVSVPKTDAWTFNDDALTQLKTTLWKRIVKSKTTARITRTGRGPSFPYRIADGALSLQCCELRTAPNQTYCAQASTHSACPNT